MNAQELFVNKDGVYEPTSIYYCEKCRIVHREKNSAEKCCAPLEKPKEYCKFCGGEVLDSCYNYHRRCEVEDALMQAKEVEIDDKMPDYFYDPYREEFDTMEMLQDYYYYNPDKTKPTFFHPCVEDRWRGLSVDAALEDSLESYFTDDYEPHNHIVDEQELHDFVEKWNKKQTVALYYQDEKSKVRLVWDNEKEEREETAGEDYGRSTQNY